MTRKFQLLTAVASLLIAAYAGGLGSQAAEWQSAPIEFVGDIFAHAHKAPQLSDGLLGSNPFPAVELFSQVVSPVRQPSWPAATISLNGLQTHDSQGPIRLPPADPSPQRWPEAPVDSWYHDSVSRAGYESNQFPSPDAVRAILPTTFPADALSHSNASAGTPPDSLSPLNKDFNGEVSSTSVPGYSTTGVVWPGQKQLVMPELVPGSPTLGVLPGPEVVPQWVQDYPMPNVELPRRTRLAARFGWWSVDDNGNPAKVGEYQSLDSSPFFDIDGLLTNGLRTWDFYGSLLDNDGSKTGGRYFGPFLSARWDYDRYLRRLDRDPLDAFVDFDQQPAAPLPPPPANFRDMKEDTTVGADFAIRVQELNASFKGKLSSNVNWRLNFWGMRKHGQRQATAMAHCYTAPNATDTNGNPVTGVACHVLSQSQRIDWLTAEVEPVVEAHYGPVTAEYSRTIRTLTTEDQLVTRPYDNLGFTGEQPYGLVPENITEIDRLKIGVTLPERRHAYARLYSGNTLNKFRDTNRRFHGTDLRVTDRSFEGVTFTAFVKTYVQTGQFPSFLLDFEDAATIRYPINYDRTSAGFNGSWRPFYDDCSWRRHLRLSCGYEYRELDRENALFVGNTLAIDQLSTVTNKIQFRAGMRWSPAWNSYARYRLAFIDDPLFAVAANDTTNTSLPTQTHRYEIGTTWSPTHTFLLTGLVGFEDGWNSSDIASYKTDNYDLVFTAWYAPTPRWSISGGLAFYSNWLDQDITLGSNSNPLTLPWEYGGRSDVVNLGTTFAWTKRITLSGTLDFVNGENAFDPLVPWPDLPFYSDVEVKTTRFMAGVDYDLGPRANCYFRYQLFDYNDASPFFDNGIPTQIARGVLRPGHDSGRAEMLLFGGTIVF